MVPGPVINTVNCKVSFKDYKDIKEEENKCESFAFRKTAAKNLVVASISFY